MTSPWYSGPPPSTPGGSASSRPDWDFSKAGKQDTRRRGQANGHATGVVSLSAALRQPAGGWATPEAREAHGGPPPADRLERGEWGVARTGGRAAHHQPVAASRLPVGPPAERRVPVSGAREAQGGGRAAEAQFEVDRPDSVSTSTTDYYLSLTQRNRDLLSHLRAPRASTLAWGGVDDEAPFNPEGAQQQAAEDGGGAQHRRNGSFRFSEAWSGFVHRPQLSVATHSRADAHAALVETATAAAAAAAAAADNGDDEQPESPQWVGSPGHDGEQQRYEEGPSPSDVLEQLALRVEDAEARAHEASQAAEARAMAAEAEAEHLRHAAAAERAEAARLAASLAELQAWSRDTAAQLVELRAATGALVMQAAAAGMEDAAPAQDAARVHRAEAETEQAQRVAAQALRDAAASAERAAAAKMAEAESRREAAAAVGQLQTALAALHGLRQAVRDALHTGSGTPAERLSALHAALGADV